MGAAWMCVACSTRPWMFQRPSAVWTRLTEGAVPVSPALREILEISMRRRQSELKRTVASTDAAVMMGSLPKEGSSSTTKSWRVKPGCGSRLIETRLKWTVRPSPAERLRSMRRWKRLMLSSGGTTAISSMVVMKMRAAMRRRRPRRWVRRGEASGSSSSFTLEPLSRMESEAGMKSLSDEGN